MKTVSGSEGNTRVTRSRTVREKETREEKGTEEDREKDGGKEGKRVVTREDKEKKTEEGKGTQADGKKKDSGREGKREGDSRKRWKGTDKEKKTEEGKGPQADGEKKDSGREGKRKRSRGTGLLRKIAIAEGIQKPQRLRRGTLTAGEDRRVFCSGEGDRIQWTLNPVNCRGKRSAYPSWEHLTSWQKGCRDFENGTSVPSLFLEPPKYSSSKIKTL